jgi:hypothetical protein
VGAAFGLLLTLSLSGCACGGAAGPVTPPSHTWALTPVPPGEGPVPEGVTLSYPGFDGGAFSAVLAVHAQEGEMSPSQALEQIAPVLRAAGFGRILPELTPGEPLSLPAPDLKALAEEICREAALQEDGTSVEVCAALRGEGPPSAEAEAAIQEAYGLSFAAMKTDLESATLQYPFSHVVGGVVVDGAGVSAFRHQGRSLSLIQGSLFTRYVLANQADPERKEKALKAARLRLAGQWGIGTEPELIGEPELVLIPDGVAPSPGGETVTALRYAWRGLLGLPNDPKSWMVWADATSGDLLRVVPQWNHGSTGTREVKGMRWRRDPGLCKPGGKPCTEVVEFQVDPLKDGNLALRLEGVFLRLENESGSSLAVSGPGFDLPPINRYQKAVCAAQGNDAFRQVNAYSHVYSLREIVKSAGIVPPFPEKPMEIHVDVRDENDKDGSGAYYDSEATERDASSSLWLADGQGFFDKECSSLEGRRLNGAQDVTVMAHETSHLFVQRLQERRPARWCGRSQPCPLPDALGHNILHDFADGLAFSYASTNCFAGWTAKNLTGVDASLYCRKSSEAGGFPRAAELPADRFPEHRRIDEREYANGQIAASALWEIRKGMRSKALAAGTAEYWVRLLRSLWGFGFLKNTCSKTTERDGRNYYDSCDRDVFLYLRDLEEKMVGQWAAAPPAGVGRQTVSKVLSGWAKAGLYLTPFVCLDGDPATTDLKACPADSSGREAAPEAVIEIDDRDTGDDPVVDGIAHPEVDYLKKSGPPPRFRVWTGPHYRFSKAGIAVTTEPPCGVRYEVEVAADAGFKTKRWTSGSVAVPPGQVCQAEMDLPAASWQALRTEPRIYYRVKTWDVLGRERISTSPGAGAFQIEPPFAVINDTGRP